jgi:pimeloyl-ACP methyl ester carboxylesterase
MKNFWKSGLRSVWGNPDGVSDSDALRFQWPSIGAGWERGLLEFARAQTMGDPDDVDDVTLLREVVNLPNTTVAIVLGAKDKVIPTSMSQRFLKDFPDVPVINLEGLGHDAFEEDIEQFLDVTEKILAEFRAKEE